MIHQKHVFLADFIQGQGTGNFSATQALGKKLPTTRFPADFVRSRGAEIARSGMCSSHMSTGAIFCNEGFAQKLHENKKTWRLPTFPEVLVSSAQEGLTAEFGMDSGVSPPLSSPGNPKDVFDRLKSFHLLDLLAIKSATKKRR